MPAANGSRIDGTTATPRPDGLHGRTVTLTGMQVRRAAGLLEDQLHDAVEDLAVAVDRGLCSGLRERSSETLAGAIDRLTFLHDQLELIGYGDAPGPITVPVDVLFPEMTR